MCFSVICATQSKRVQLVLRCVKLCFAGFALEADSEETADCNSVACCNICADISEMSQENTRKHNIADSLLSTLFTDGLSTIYIYITE
jgi:hypothetical protein